MVLSVIPHFNRALGESIQQSLASAPFVTMLTDFADYPPHFWMEAESEYIICGTQRARRQALVAGHAAHKLFETSGMVLKPRFYKRSAVDRNLDRNLERERLGLDAGVSTALVLFGGHGSQAMVQIAKRLDASRGELQLIMLCGHNDKLRAQLKALRTRHRLVVEGFTSNVDFFMSLADFFIGKPGPGSISEALQFDLPVIVERNARTMPQERYNTEWILENRVGIVLSSFAEIASGVDRLCDPANFAEFSRNARDYSNRALAEVPVILDTIFKQHAASIVPFDSSLSAVAWAGLT
jgi:1,2-diacylglycerol 3-beta-galactosyltransferase